MQVSNGHAACLVLCSGLSWQFKGRSVYHLLPVEAQSSQANASFVNITVILGTVKCLLSESHDYWFRIFQLHAAHEMLTCTA